MIRNIKNAFRAYRRILSRYTTGRKITIVLVDILIDLVLLADIAIDVLFVLHICGVI